MVKISQTHHQTRRGTIKRNPKNKGLIGTYGTVGGGKTKIVLNGKYEIDGDKAYTFLENKNFDVQVLKDGELLIGSHKKYSAIWELSSDAGGYIKIRKKR